MLEAVLGIGLPFSPEGGHWSPLHWACRTGNPEIIERLVEEGLRGGCVTHPQLEGRWDPVSIAIYHGNEKMLKELSALCRSLLDTGVDAVRFHGRLHNDYWCSGYFHVSRWLKSMETI